MKKVLGNEWVQFFGAILLLIALCYFIYSIRAILFPFIVSFAIAYLLDPVVDFLERRKISRLLAIVIVVCILLIILALFILIIVPSTITQFQHLAGKFPGYLETIQHRTIPAVEKFLHIDIPNNTEQLYKELMNRFYSLQEIPWDKLSPLTGYLSKVFSSLLSFIITLVNLVLIPILAFYFLLDIDKIYKKVREFIPLKYRDEIVGWFKQVHAVLSGFIRGQLTVCLILAVMYSTGLAIVGIPLWALIGIIAGFSNLIPYLGYFIGIIPSLLLALLEYGDLKHILGVFIAFTIVQTIEGNLLTPKIVGNKVGLHPLVVVLALLIGGKFFGFIGVLVALPVTAVLNVFFKIALNKYLSSRFYLGDNAAKIKDNDTADQ